jgi:hypothetical protein
MARMVGAYVSPPLEQPRKSQSNGTICVALIVGPQHSQRIDPGRWSDSGLTVLTVTRTMTNLLRPISQSPTRHPDLCTANG